MNEDTCPECGKEWNSEYHISDVCVNLDEDMVRDMMENQDKDVEE